MPAEELADDLSAALTVLDAVPAPRGRELAAAHALREWASVRWPAIGWQLERHGEHGANLVATHGAGPLLYSHLDTSLDGSPRDALVTGRTDAVGSLRIALGVADGFGLGVARAPAAAALVAFAGAGAGTLVLAGSGTHRRGAGPAGIAAYLDAHGVPDAAIVAKSGPPALLWEEPGALYLTVTVTGGAGAALAPDSARPSGGMPAHAGVVLAALSEWRAGYLAADPRAGQLGRAAGIGALRAGWADKPDLLPAGIAVGMYVVTGPGVDPQVLAGDVERQVRTACAAAPLAGCAVHVDLETVSAAGATDPDAPIVAAARAAWTAEFGRAPEPITGWTGSTDGALLRDRGIDTVRLGPQPTPAAEDPRRDSVSLDVLAGYARIYRRLLG